MEDRIYYKYIVRSWNGYAMEIQSSTVRPFWIRPFMELERVEVLLPILF